MAGIRFDPRQLHARAVELGLVADGEPLPRHLENRVKQSLLGDDDTSALDDVPTAPAGRIVVHTGRGVVIDGQPLPHVLADDPIEVVLGQGVSTVRVTLAAHDIEITPPPENRA